MNQKLPKRLIEVDLPIKAISAHARREKSIRHGHISSLHIWWARRPLAACRAVVCAALWPDPVDQNCPQTFRDVAALVLAHFAEQVRINNELGELCTDHWSRWVRTNSTSLRSNDPVCWTDLRYALLDFIADFANWDASTVPAFLDTARLLTHVSHLALNDAEFILNTTSSTNLNDRIENIKSQIKNLSRPLVVDPFAGGGAIPFEALRIGADAFASDLNPVAVLLNKTILELIPQYGNKLVEKVEISGKLIREQAVSILERYYPQDIDGSTPISYIWARKVLCEGPGCGTEIPLIRSLWLAKKGERSVALQLVPNTKEKKVDLIIIEKKNGKWVSQDSPYIEIPSPFFDGTVRRGSATCPVCGYTMPVDRVRFQLKQQRGGSSQARLMCVVTTRSNSVGRFYRLANQGDIDAIAQAQKKLEQEKLLQTEQLSFVPDESTKHYDSFVNRGPIYGMENWGDYYTPRQQLALATISSLIRNLDDKQFENSLPGLYRAVKTLLAMALDKQADLGNALNRWEPIAQCPRQLFARQALPMVWDFAESVPIGESSGSFSVFMDGILNALKGLGSNWLSGTVERASATHHPLPDDSAQAVVTDPPYYYSVQYADLSDFFYTWLKRSLWGEYPELFGEELTPKAEEIIVQSPNHEYAPTGKNRIHYENKMGEAMSEGRRILAPSGIGVVVFAHTSTSGWESQIQSMISAGWTITGSWPIDTEMGTRVIAQGRSVLASSIHLVCRPRENPDGTILETVGDWRDVLGELPNRIHAWLPHLSNEGVVGADAIFACLGPALEIFSRYSRVEKASGEQVSLKDYLEIVWAAIAKEALTMIFEGVDTTGFEEDARVTAMWLWTLSAQAEGANGKDAARQSNLEDEPPLADDVDTPLKAEVTGGFVLEYDAARKIAQGLGAHLERMETLVEVKGDKARLRSVSERAHALFGRQEDEVLGKTRKKAAPQLSLFAALDEAEAQQNNWEKQLSPVAGSTSLDRLHQAMLLFATGRGEALKRFLVDDGIGKDQRFWRLAQALSALYPSGSDEKRWVDGVLARKKGLGF